MQCMPFLCHWHCKGAHIQLGQDWHNRRSQDLDQPQREDAREAVLLQIERAHNLPAGQGAEGQGAETREDTGTMTLP